VRFGETWSHGGASIAFAAPEAGSRIAMLLCPVDSFVTRGAAQNRDAADSLVTFSKGCRTASQRRIMTDKLPRTRTEFEALVLAELHATSQCHGAVHVTVVAYDDYRVPATWEVASCGAGTSPPEECGRALCDVVGRLQQRAPTSPLQGECHQRVHARLPTRYARALQSGRAGRSLRSPAQQFEIAP
jgi:hypothetical protein